MGSQLAKLFVVIGADISGFSKGMKSVKSQLSGVANNMTSIGKQMSLAVTAPIVAIGTLAFKAAGDFDQAFRQVNVMLGASAEEAANYKERILDISDATGKAATDVVNAYYQIVSAGYRGADSLDILETAMRGATGGAADAVSTTQALTKAMNIFKLEGVEGSARAMDTFFGIVDSGLLTFEEMANTFPQAATMAAGLKVEIEEVGAALATLTKVSGSTEKASTALNAVFTQLIKPSADLMKLYEQWGVSTGPEAIEKFGGFAGVLKAVNEATGGNVDALGKLFPSVEAIRAVLPLVTTNSEDFADALDTVSGATGRTGEAFEEMAQGPGFQWQQMMNTLKNAAIKLGDAIATTLGPWIEKLINIVQRAVDWFSNLSPAMKRTIVIIGGVAAAIGPLLLVTGSLIKAFITVKAAMIGLTTAFHHGTAAMVTHKVTTVASEGATKGATVAQLGLNKAMLANPIIAIIAGITALVIAIVYMWRNWERVSLNMERAWTNFKNVVAKGVDGIMRVWEKMTSQLPGLQSFFTKVREGITGMIDDNEVKLRALGVERAWQDLEKAVKENSEQMVDDVEMATDQMISSAEMEAEQAIAAAERVRDEEKRVLDQRIEFYRNLTSDRLRQIDKQMVAELAAINPDLGEKAQAYMDLLDEQGEADEERNRKLEEDRVAELEDELGNNDDLTAADKRRIKDQIADYEAGWEAKKEADELWQDIMNSGYEDYFEGQKTLADEAYEAEKVLIEEKCQFEIDTQKGVFEAFKNMRADDLEGLRDWVVEHNRIMEEAGLKPSTKGLEVPEGPPPAKRERPSNPIEFFQWIKDNFDTGGVLRENMLMVGASTGRMYTAQAGETIVPRGGGGGNTYYYNVHLHDPIVREDKDISRLAKEVSREMEIMQERTERRRGF